ncbi:GTPase [Nocardia gipuzkoensis]|uniref:GTPase n=1 Tax=Nocardia gipuzkoensis TaxID=2749991 RepID=UPI003EE1E7EC
MSGHGEAVRGVGTEDRSARLLADVRAVLAAAGQVMGDPAGEQLSRLRMRLDEPLTIAVAGRTNAGKSTLVNALICAQVAPTRATECTKVVTWYRFGPHQPRLVCRDGAVVPVFPEQGRLPDDLGVPTQQIDRLEVWLNSEPLRDVTVIDTPGLSGDRGLADQTERLLASGAADVLVFVFGQALHADEAEIVSDFRAAGIDLYDFPGNAMGVLSRADLLGDSDETWPRALVTAAGHAKELSSAIAGVVPVMGKIAETTETGAFDEAQAKWLRTLAGLPDCEREEALLFAGAFDRLECLPPGGRAKLLERLDMHGIRVIAGTATPATPAAAMNEQLRSLSGIAELRRRLEVLFLRPAAVHKTVRALAGLEALLSTANLPARHCCSLLDQIENIRHAPAMHALAELRALAWLYSGRCEFRDEQTTESALTLFEGSLPAHRLNAAPDTPPTELAQLARAAANRWRAYANAANGREAQVADTASWSAFLIETQLREAL